MRADMHEVLIERPRSGMRTKSARGNKPRVGEWDGEDGYVRSYDPGRNRSKYLSDLLSPLKRWLRKQVGRPWDKVWSELCAGIDTRNVIGRHLMDHARRFVATECRVDADRKVWVLAGNLSYEARWPYNESGWVRARGLYVDPRTGLLRWVEPPRRPRVPYSQRGLRGDADVRQVSENRFLLKRDGIWYAVDTERARAGRWEDRPKADFTWDRIGYVIVRKRQMNSRQLRDAALANDA